MATSVLTTTYLNFNSGVTQYARFTASADILNFTGAGGANSVKLSNITDPTAAQDAATKNYVDSVANGLVWKSPVTACSYGVGNLTLSAPQTVDGVSLIAGNRILVADQTNPVQNGIYVVAAGAWTRATDMPTGSDAASNAVFCQQGTTNADNGFVCTSNTGSAVVGTDPLAFVIFTNIVPVTPGGATTTLQYNNAGVFGGISNFTTNGTTTMSATAGILSLDAASELDIANTEITFDGATDVLKYYTNAVNNSTRFYGVSGYDFYVSDDSAGYTTYFKFESATGISSSTGGFSIPTDSTNLSIGSTGQLTAQFNGTNSVVATSAGNLNLTAGATNKVVALLGSTTNATSFQVQDSATVAALTVYGSADTVAAAQLTVQGELSKYTNTTTINTAANVTYTAAQMFGGLLLRDPNGANRSDSTDTATNIVGSIVDPVVGSSYEFVVNNTAVAAENITLVAGTGVTLVGTMTVGQFQLRHFLVIITNVGTPAVTIYDNGFSSSTTTVSAAGADTQVQYNNSGVLGAVSSFAFNKNNVTPILDVGNNAATTAAVVNVGNGGTNSTGTIALSTGTGVSLIDAQGSGTFTMQGAGAVAVTGATNATVTSTSGTALLNSVAGAANVTGSTSATITAGSGTATVQSTTGGVTLTAATNLTETGDLVQITSTGGAITISSFSTADMTGSTGATVTATTGNAVLDATAGDANVTAGTNIGVTAGNNATVTSSTGTALLTATAGAANVTGSTTATVTAGSGTALLTSTSGAANVTGATNSTMTATSGTATVTGNAVALTSTGVATNMIATLGDAAGATEFRVNDSANVTQFKVDSDGKGTFTGDAYANAFFTTSDATLKENIIPLSDSLSMIKNIEGYQYNWKDEDASQELQYGVLAQQIEEAGLEHLVSENNGHKTVNYLGLIPILIEAVKELSLKLEKQSREQKQNRLGK